MKPWYTSKTLWFNTIMAFTATIEASTQLLQPHIPFNIYFSMIVIMPAVNVWLRMISTTELTK